MRKLHLVPSKVFSAAIIPLLWLSGAAGQTTAPAPSLASFHPEYLGDHPELIFAASQGWGEMGWNAAAHESGRAGAPLQIGDHTYTRGLGHHASGSIELLLEGDYAAFDAEAGLQPCGGGGSVIFRVFVDGQQRFDSGILRATNAPVPVHVVLAGAQELRLEANDAGDGITCDMANWVNARLTRADTAARHEPDRGVDIAPFARVVTSDPNRDDGARASRIEEFRAEDLFLETDLPTGPDGTYRVPVSANGLGCIGLQWLNRRALRELALEFLDPSHLPATNSVQVQGWFGESAWQGNWKPLVGDLQATGSRLTFHLSPGAGVVQTRKIRWVFPAKGETVVQPPCAFSRSHWQTVHLLVEAERGRVAQLLSATASCFLREGERPREPKPPREPDIRAREGARPPE